MGNRHVYLSIVALALICAPLSRAHHAVHGHYDYNATIALTGNITRVDWINPHVRILLDVTEEDGSVATWELTSAPAQFMHRTGLSKSKLMEDGGEPVKINCIRARNPDLRQAWAYWITYADGRFYELSTRRPGG